MSVVYVLIAIHVHFSHSVVRHTQAQSYRGRRRSKGVPVGAQTKHDPDVCGRKNVRNMEKVTICG